MNDAVFCILIIALGVMVVIGSLFFGIKEAVRIITKGDTDDNKD